MDRRSFLLKSAAGAALVATSSMGARASTNRISLRPVTAATKMNWGENVTFRATKIYSPSSVNNLCEIVKEEANIKVFGSTHSFNSIMKEDRAQISLKNFPYPQISVDRAKNRVTVPGNMTLNEINSNLEKLGFSLSIMGEIDKQTISGAIATGTHGSSLYHGTISDKVAGVKFIRADGEIVELNEDVIGDRETLKAFRVHLGALGIILTVTLNVEPLYYLKRTIEVMHIDDALNPDLHRKSEYVQLYYMPYTDKALVFQMKRIPKSEVRFDDDFFGEHILDNKISNYLVKFSSLAPSQLPRVLNFMINTYKPRKASHVSHRMLIFERNFKVREMELSVRYENTRDALKAIRKNIQSEAARGYHWNLPIIIRFIKDEGKSYLSPAAGRELVTCFSMPVHNVFWGDYENSYRRMEEDLVKNFDARPHLGKLFWKNPMSSFDSLQDFKSIQSELDPSGKFVNAYISATLLDNGREPEN